jgi:hypothetical protein
MRSKGVSLADAALLRAMRIREAITRYRADRSTDSITRALVSTTQLPSRLQRSCSWPCFAAFVWRSTQSSGAYRSRVHSLTNTRSFEVVRADSIWRGMKSVLGTLRILSSLAIVYALCAFALREFPRRAASQPAGADRRGPLQSMGMAVLRYLPKLAFLVLLFIIIRYVLKLLGRSFDAVHTRRCPLRNFDAEWARPTLPESCGSSSCCSRIVIA